MTQAVIIARGTGYDYDTTFDEYEVIRHPCPERADRASFAYTGSFLSTETQPLTEGRRLQLVTHESHSVALARSKLSPNGGYSYILLQHGGGRRVIQLHTSDDWRSAIMQLPERLAYEVLRTTAQAAEDADRVAAEAEGMRWRRAVVDGRVRKSRPKRGSVSVTIAPWYESKSPDLVARRQTGEVFEVTRHHQADGRPDAQPGWYFFNVKDAGPSPFGPYVARDLAQLAKNRVDRGDPASGVKRKAVTIELGA